MRTTNLLLAASLSCLFSAPALATTFDISLTGDTTNFSTSSFDFSGLHFDRVYFPLAGLDSTNAFAVAQGDVVDATVSFNNAVTIPASMIRTDFLHLFFGSAFPSENTGVTGTFTLFFGGATVATWDYSSTTSDQLASFAAIFPPNNGALTFESFSNTFTITDLATPATLDDSAFFYDLVSTTPAVPEPATWAMMIAGFGLTGTALRRHNARKLSVRIA